MERKKHGIPFRTVHEMPETAGMQATSIRQAQTAGTPTTAGMPKTAGTPTTAGRNANSRERQQEKIGNDQQDCLLNFYLFFLLSFGIKIVLVRAFFRSSSYILV
jgi:hypothetical protein